MSSLDANRIRRALSAKSGAALAELELFGSIVSTNTHLLAQPSPAPGQYRVAIADYQTSGRGRHNRRWVSPPGAGLCLSLSYTFEEQPGAVPCLTLAIGVGIINALEKLGIDGASLKWPNDIVARDSKLGGILTEMQSRPKGGATVVTGIGLNIRLPDGSDIGTDSEWARKAVDLAGVAATMPQREDIAGQVIDGVYNALRKFDAFGFVRFADEWARYDWLRGQQITVSLPDTTISGVAAGVDTDGALLVDTGDEKVRVVSGSIAVAARDGDEP